MAKRRISKLKSATDPVKASSERIPLPQEYRLFLSEVKARIRVAQVGAALSVNRELIGLYWQIGQSIVDRQRSEG